MPHIRHFAPSAEWHGPAANKEQWYKRNNESGNCPENEACGNLLISSESRVLAGYYAKSISVSMSIFASAYTSYVAR